MSAESLIQKLDRERFVVEEGRDDFDRGWREGWNARGETIKRDLEQMRTLEGLRELRAAEPRVMSGVVQFDLSDSGGEG